jgi:MFS-type transporter involved in bile tolerance (Atg22 family)
MNTTDKYKSRKFILSIILMVTFTLLVIFKYIPSDDYIESMLALYGIYAGANVTSKFFNKE